jgi:hypothetical protein
MPADKLPNSAELEIGARALDREASRKRGHARTVDAAQRQSVYAAAAVLERCAAFLRLHVEPRNAWLAQECQTCGHIGRFHQAPGTECVHRDDDGNDCPCSSFKVSDAH